MTRSRAFNLLRSSLRRCIVIASFSSWDNSGLAMAPSIRYVFPIRTASIAPTHYVVNTSFHKMFPILTPGLIALAFVPSVNTVSVGTTEK